MPIKIPNNLPAVDILAKENIFVMDENRALSQDIRPLKFIIINLMPTKIETETQLLRLLSNTPLQMEVTFLKMASYVSKNVSKEHMSNFYKTFKDIKNDYFDEEAEYDIISGNKALKTIKVDAGAEEALVKKLYGISASVNVTTE